MSVATSYSRALFETCKESGFDSAKLDKVLNELKTFSEAIESSEELSLFLNAPTYTIADKNAVIQSLVEKMKGSPQVSNFLQLLVSKGRVRNTAEIVSEFENIKLKSEGSIKGVLTSSEPLSGQLLEELASSFKKKLGRNIVFQTQIDSTLLGGFVVVIDGVSYDGSLKSQLKQLREKLVFGKGSELSH